MNVAENPRDGEKLLRVLHLDDSPRDAEIIRQRLIAAGFSLHLDLATHEKQFTDFLRGDQYDLILADDRIPGFDVTAALRLSKSVRPGCPFICVSGAVGEDVAVGLVKQGATDCVSKERLDRLPLAIQRALDEVSERNARQQAEQALRFSEEMHRTLVEKANEGIIIAQEGAFVFANQRMADLLGASVGDLEGRPFVDFVWPDDRELVTANHRKRLAGGAAAETYDIRVIGAGGRLTWVSLSVAAIQWQGKPATLCLLTDITGRKQTEELLRQSEEKIRLVLDSAAEGVYGLDVDGNCTFCNRACLEILGYQRADELLGKNMHWQIHAKHPDGTHFPVEDCRIFRAFRKGDGTHVDDEVLWRSDDTSFSAEYWSFPQRRDGVVVGAVVTFLDITERKKVEVELRRSEEKFSKAFQTSPYAVTITRARDGAFLEVNDAFVSMAECSREEALAGSSVALRMWVDEGDRQRVVAALHAGRVVTGQEFLFRAKSGRVFSGLFSAQTIELGQEACIVSSILDISERKQAEEALRQMEARLRQSEKMKAIGQLAGGIAHDFNNVLGGIIGFTVMSLDFADEGSTLKNNLLQVLKASERAKNMVQQILTFSRQGNPQKSVIAIRPLIEEALDLLRASTPSLIIFESDLQNNLPPILADPTKIHEVLLNLAGNAVHAMQHKGTLTVRLSAEFLDHAVPGRTGDIAPGKYNVIEVADTGCGMDATTMSRAFEPFFTTKAVGEGTGMGLSVVLGIVQSHGGDIQVESVMGKGAIFRVYLPAAEESVSDVSDEGTSVSVCGNERILFVDDEQMMVDVAKVLFTKFGYSIIGMTSSLDALKFIREKGSEIDILITDLAMPGLTGIELAKEALKVRQGLPVVLCSGHSQNVNPARAATIGIGHFVTKPYRAHEIAAAVRAVLDNK
jgi:PAS domain S-box-containing protein